jgi:hypothetical protein
MYRLLQSILGGIDMIRKLLVLFLSTVLIIFCFSIPTFAIERERVSVFEFSSGAKVDNTYKIAAANKLTKILFSFKRFDMIERTEIDRILAEQKFQNTGLVDQDKAVEIGKLLNIDYAFIGHIDHLSTTFKKSGYDANAKITVKIINIRSGKLLHIIEADGISTDSKEQTALLGALDACFSENLMFELRNAFAPFSSIFKVEKDFIYISNGENIAIKNGIRYRILRPEKTSDSMEDIADSFKTEIGFAQVVQVTETKSKAKIIAKKEPIEEGDLVQELSADEEMIIEEPEPEPEIIEPEEEEQIIGVTPEPEEIEENVTDITEPEDYKEEPKKGGAWVNTFSMRFGEGYEGWNPSGTYEYRLGYESESSGINVGLTAGLGATPFTGMYNIGLEVGQDIPLIKNFLHLTCSGIAGLAFGENFYTFELEESLYLVGTAGARMFLFGFKGLRLQYDLTYQLGPIFTNGWDDCSGVGSRMSLGICF